MALFVHCLFRWTLRVEANVRNKSTIFSLSSGAGKAGVAIIRVSGPDSLATLQKICRGQRARIVPRQMFVAGFRCPQTGDLIDRGMAVWFQGPKSYTGEDVCEFYIHGGVAVISDFLNALSKVPGLRPAEAGEFTKRAFYNNKLDLAEIEGLADLIHAETTAQRKLALRQTEGELSRLYSSWRERLLKATANVEAFIDFGEDDNIESDVLQVVDKLLLEVGQEMKVQLTNSRSSERVRAGIHVVITGKPNSGKSSLLNLLCQRPAAIVTSIPGTTRDALEISHSIAGYPVILTDTAGIRATTDIVEAEGVRRAKQRLRSADLLFLMIDVTECTQTSDFVKNRIATELTEVFDEINSGADGANTELPEVIVILNKIDLIDPNILKRLQKELTSIELCGVHVNIVLLTCLSTDGLDLFLTDVTAKLKKLCDPCLVGSPTFSQMRQRVLVARCLECVQEYSKEKDVDLVIAAQKLRTALFTLAKITGAVSTEDILDVIFRDFCIGK